MENATLASLITVFIGVLLVGTFLAPTIAGYASETTTIDNEGAGDVTYAYIEDSTDYSLGLSSDGTTVTLGDQSADAEDMIAYASDLAAVVYADGVFFLIAADTVTDLGLSATVASSDGTLTITDEDGTEAYTSDAVGWAYVPETGGTFGLFADVGADLDRYPLAAAGSFAGIQLYNDLGDTELVMAYTQTDGVLEEVSWGLEDDTETVLTASVSLIRSAEVPTATYQDDTDSSWGFNLNATGATIVSYSGAGGSITIPDTVSTGGTSYTVTALGIGSYNMPIFDNSTISSTTSTVTIPSSVTSIGNSAFYNCSGFTGSLTIPSSVTSIGGNTFQGCSGFTGSLTIPSSVTSIGLSAFYNCSGFTGSLTIPSSVTSIGDYAFQGCSGFTGPLTIPSSVTSIGIYAFQGCSGFTGPLTIPSSVTSIGMYAFQRCSGFTGLAIFGSPTIGTTALSMSAVTEVLNLGETEITAGSYGLSSSAEVRDDVPLMGYIAPTSISETVQKEGAEYVMMGAITILALISVVVSAVGVLMVGRGRD